eukprot:3765073-Rhodomonas_salina.2
MPNAKCQKRNKKNKNAQFQLDFALDLPTPGPVVTGRAVSYRALDARRSAPTPQVLTAYARPTPCPVLTARIALPGPRSNNGSPGSARFGSPRTPGGGGGRPLSDTDDRKVFVGGLS